MGSMVYLALLRGINVGGKSKVKMARLTQTFDRLGFSDVKTYINSGNVIFRSNSMPDLAMIERAIQADFGFAVPVLVRDLKSMQKLVNNIPDSWVNSEVMRCDVLFLWDEIDKPEILESIPAKPDIEDVVYFPGAVVWRIDRKNVKRGAVPKIIGTGVYKQVTIRNASTVRKLYELMKAL